MAHPSCSQSIAKPLGKTVSKPGILAALLALAPLLLPTGGRAQTVVVSGSTLTASGAGYYINTVGQVGITSTGAGSFFDGTNIQVSANVTATAGVLVVDNGSAAINGGSIMSNGANSNNLVANENGVFVGTNLTISANIGPSFAVVINTGGQVTLNGGQVYTTGLTSPLVGISSGLFSGSGVLMDTNGAGSPGILATGGTVALLSSTISDNAQGSPAIVGLGPVVISASDTYLNANGSATPTVQLQGGAQMVVVGGSIIAAQSNSTAVSVDGAGTGYSSTSAYVRSNGDAVVVSGNATGAITGGTIVSANGADTGVTITGGAVVTMSNAVVNSNGYGVQAVNSGSVTITGGTVNATGDKAGVTAASGGAVSLTGGAVNANNGVGLLLDGANSSLSATNATVATTGGYGASVINGGTMALTTSTVSTQGGGAAGLSADGAGSTFAFGGTNVVSTTGSGANGVQAINGAHIDINDASPMPQITVSGNNASALDANGDGSRVTVGGNQSMSVSMATGAGSTGATAENNGVIAFADSGNSGGASLRATTGGTLLFTQNGDAAGSRVILDANSTLDASQSTNPGGAEIGSLQSTADSSRVKLGDSGTLSIGNNNAANNGTLLASSTYAGIIEGGAGSGLVKTGSGSLTLTGDLSNDNATTYLQGGDLVLDGTAGKAQLTGTVLGSSGDTNLYIVNGATLTGVIDVSEVIVGPGSVWTMTASSNIHSLTNDGTVTFPKSDGSAFSTLDILTQLAGSGTFNMTTNFAATQGDLIIVGGTASGNLYLNIGDNSTPNGKEPPLMVVQTQTSPGTFSGTANIGMFTYTVNNGATIGLDPNNWYLTNPNAAIYTPVPNLPVIPPVIDTGSNGITTGTIPVTGTTGITTGTITVTVTGTSGTTGITTGPIYVYTRPPITTGTITVTGTTPGGGSVTVTGTAGPGGDVHIDITNPGVDGPIYIYVNPPTAPAAPPISPGGSHVQHGPPSQSSSWFLQPSTILGRMGEVRLRHLAFENDEEPDGKSGKEIVPLSGKEIREPRPAAPGGRHFKRFEPGTWAQNAWVKGYGQRMNVDARVVGHAFHETLYGLDIGTDRTWWIDSRNLLVAGVFGGGGGSRTTFSEAFFGKGRMETGYGGLYGSWLHASGFYADLMLKAERFDNHFDVLDINGRSSRADYATWGLGESLQIGQQFRAQSGWFIEPQLEVGHAHFIGTDYTVRGDGTFGVHQGGGDVFNARGGLTMGRIVELDSFHRNGACRRPHNAPGSCPHERAFLQPYLRANVSEQASTGNRIVVDRNSFRPNMDGTRLELGAGMIWQVNPRNQFNLSYDTIFAKHYDVPWSVSLSFQHQF